MTESSLISAATFSVMASAASKSPSTRIILAPYAYTCASLPDATFPAGTVTIAVTPALAA